MLFLVHLPETTKYQLKDGREDYTLDYALDEAGAKDAEPGKHRGDVVAVEAVGRGYCDCNWLMALH